MFARFTVCCLLLAGSVHAAAPQSIIDESLADRSTLDASMHPYTCYLTTDNLPEESRERVARILAFSVCSMTRVTTLENQLPYEVRPGLYRINLLNLGWYETLPQILVDSYPYGSRPHYWPLVIRADWFIQFCMDQEEGGDAYLQLLFGKKGLKKLDEILAIIEADVPSDYTFGHIESNSGVALNKTRVITTVPTSQRVDCWITYDYVEINRKTDPLENLLRGIRDGQHGHDASEIIFGIPKSLASTGQTGLLQAYVLADGKGNLQAKAPTNIVVDSTGVRGVEIRNPISCIACHKEGLRPLKENALREFVASGAVAYTDYKSQVEIDRYHLTNIDKLITRNNEDYEVIVQACNGYTAEQNSAAFILTIQEYDQPLKLEDAARELYVMPEDLRLAFGWASAHSYPIGARLAQLAHGGEIQRDAWEKGDYYEAYKMLLAWRAG